MGGKESEASLVLAAEVAGWNADTVDGTNATVAKTRRDFIVDWIRFVLGWYLARELFLC